MDNAPITQLLLTLQFVPPVASLGPIEIAACSAEFRDEFPHFEQVSRAGPMPTDPSVAELSLSIGPARTRLSTSDGSRSILFQEDRFSYGWDRIVNLEESSGYPGFEIILTDAIKIWNRLRSIIENENADFTLLSAEIAYSDAFEAEHEGVAIPLHSIFNVISENYKSSMIGYNFTWSEPLQAVTGFIEMQVTGPAAAPFGVFTNLQTVGRFKPKAGWLGMADDFATVHDEILEAFKKLVNPAVRPN